MKRFIASIVTIAIIATVINYINNYHTCSFYTAHVDYGNCQTEGYIIKRCRSCDEEKRETLPKGDHVEKVVLQEKASTCLESGYTKKTECSLCGVVVRESSTIEPLGHSGTADTDGYGATCLEEGKTNSIKCIRCEVVLEESQTISPLGHSEMTIHDGYEPTCLEEGKTNTKKCSRCDCTLQESVSIDALGHCDENENGFCDECNTIYGEHVIKITTVADLKNIANKLDGAYMLMNDIDLQGETWTPIGDSVNKFTGAFVGQGHKISGLNCTNRESFGLFGYSEGVISDLTLSNCKATLINTSSTFAFLCAINDGKIENCTIEGNNIVNVIAQNIKMNQGSESGKEEFSVVAGEICAINRGEILNCTFKDGFSINISNNTFYQLDVSEVGEYKLESILNINFGKVAGENFGKISDVEFITSINNATVNAEARENGDKGLAISKINGSIGSLVGLNKGEIVACNVNPLTVNKSIVEDGVEYIDGYDVGGISEINLSEDENYANVIGKNDGTVVVE